MMQPELNRERSGVSLRAVVIGSLLCFTLAVLEVRNMMVTIGSFLSYDAACPIAAFFLFLLGLANLALLKKRPAAALSASELLVIYGMLLVANIVPTFGLAMRFFPIVTGVVYYATSVNEWAKTIFPHLNRLLFLQDASALKGFYEGLSAGERIPWAAWMPMLAAWTVFYAGFFLFILTLLNFFRRQWSERERLAYPLAQLPLAIAERRGSSHPFYTDRLMWLGLAIPLGIGTFKYLGYLFPVIPALPLQYDVPIFRNTASIHLRLSFAALGLTYFMGQDLAFSLWVFYLLLTAEQGIFNITGITLIQPVPFAEGRDLVTFQSAGAFLVFVLFAAWEARGSIRSVLRRGTGGSGAEMLNGPAAGGWFGGSALLFFLFLLLMGIQPLMALFYFFLLTVLILGVGKSQSQGGLITSSVPIRSTTAAIALTGANHLKPGSIAGLSLNILPFGQTVIANIQKMTEGEPRKKLIPAALLLGFIISLLTSFWMILLLAYRSGAINAHNWLFQSQPNGIWRFVGETIKHPTGPNVQAIGFLVGGGILYSVLAFLRYRVLWWPLHPLGFAFAANYYVTTLWFPVFLGWLIKTLILRYAGVPTFRRMKTFFLGLILGQFTTNCIYVLVDMATKRRGNDIFWW